LVLLVQSPEQVVQVSPGEAPVERSIAWLVADGCRRVPYRGIARKELWWSVRVAAVNLRRLLALGLARHDHAWVLA
jgi:hypothetical protein